MRAERIQLVNDIGQMMTDAKYVYIVSYKGLTVKDFTSFRNDLSVHASECHVLKNRLIRKAAEIRGVSGIAGLDLRGDSAMIIGNGDPGAVAKVIDAFSSSHEHMKPKAGYLEGQALGRDDIVAIAKMPPREVLLSQLVGLLQSPTRNLVSVLHAKASSIVNVVSAYMRKREGNESN
jgi:large subunit ribosomal protein L10